MVCDKVVCERWWVTKLCVKDGGGGGGGAGWYRIKNKNPTQRCGGKNAVLICQVGSKRQDGNVVATLQVTAFNQVLSNVLNR